jgi:hypothetical protein
VSQAARHFGANGFRGTKAAPNAVTRDASAITANQATLTGTVNPNGAATTFHFEHGKTPTYGSSTPDSNAGGGTTDQAESAVITGLSPYTDYHYRISAKNSVGETPGGDHQFKTLPSTKYQDAVKIPKLLSYWRLGETLGAWAFDSVPPPAAKNQGFYSGGCTLGKPGVLTGDPDTAVGFDGTDDEMTANGPLLTTPGECSIEGWFYWEGGGALLSDDAGLWRFGHQRNGQLSFFLGGGNHFDTPRTAASVQNAWHHFVATKDAAGNVVFYLDGQQIHSGSGAGNTAPKMPWHLMRDRSSGQYAKGTADEVAIYGVVLDLGIVQAQVNAAQSG